MTFVALGCSPDPCYAFLAPLTALLWREVVGFHPVVIVVGRGRSGGIKCSGVTEWALDPLAKLSLKALKTLKISTYSVAAVDGYPYAMTAQCVRQCAPALHAVSDFGGYVETQTRIKEGDWWMPADADLWPLKREFYQQHLGGEHRATIYYANGDHFTGRRSVEEAVRLGKRFQTIPTCHVAMRVRDWRTAYKNLPGENLADAVERCADEWFKIFPRTDFNLWMTDQDLMTWRLCTQEWFPQGAPPADMPRAKGEVLFVPRQGHPPRDRLDRSMLSHWETTGEDVQAGRWQDAHMHREPYSPLHWEQTLPIIDALVPHHASWAREYHAEFTAALVR